MQLNSVVLPAPLGPMRPTISPLSMTSETLLLATRPPKRLVADSTLSSVAIALAVGGGRPRRRTAPLAAEPPLPRQRQQARRTEGGDEDDDHAVDDQVDAAAGERSRAERGAHDLRDGDEDHRAEHRAPQMPDAADDGGHDRQ